ncbi:MAG: hypothetical protein C4K48_00345 [Candidatus Thorarchaeota archaeon]|nr:MAG: hypothetical protein C4K48_00345 [Candidatus Thorarchaeota archaeon]
MFDVAVIGAGPAGSTASRYLAKQGLKVCIIDKDTFPRNKPCGGGFAQGLLDDFPYLKKRADEFLKGIARLGILHSPNLHIALSGKVEMAMTLRTDFDNVLLESALEQGAASYIGSRARHITIRPGSSKVELANGNSIKSCMIVGADGVSSIVARESGLQRSWPKSKITACRVAEVPAKQDEIIDRYTEDLQYHFYASFGGLPGYGWIFPKRETINVGLGIVGAHARGLPTIFETFVRYLKSENLLARDADLSSVRGALVPTGGPAKKTVSDGCLIVGDAAGMVDPLTGGGIAYAMRAGRHASRAIATAFDNGLEHETLLKYEQSWKNDFGKDFKGHLLAQKVITSPFTDLFFEIGRRDELIQKMVSESMDNSSKSKIDTRNLVLRTLLVCLRGALGI